MASDSRMFVLGVGALKRHWLFNLGLIALSLTLARGVNRQETLERLREIKGERRHQPNYTNPEDCEWPHCLPKCEPCATKQVDTCLLSYVSEYMFGCSERFGPTECFLDKCLCQEGFCAEQLELTHAWRCVPQVCTAGSSPPPFEPNWWVRLYAFLGGGHYFPSPDEINLVDFMKMGAFPLFVMVWGILMATVTFIELFCRTKHDFKVVNDDITSPAQKPVQQASTIPTQENRYPFLLGSSQNDSHPEASQKDSELNVAATDGEDAARNHTREDDSRKALMGDRSEVGTPSRPSMLPMLTISIIIVCLTVLGIRMRSASHARNESIVANQLSRAQRDAQIVADQVSIIDATAKRIKKSLDELSYTCRSALFIDNVDEYAVEYVDMIEHISDSVRPIPEQIDNARSYVTRNSFLAIWIPQAPLLLIVLICAAIVVEATFTSCWGSSAFGDAVDKRLRYSSILFVLIIILVSLCTGLILCSVITLSRFCTDVDQNLYDTIVYSTGPNMTEVHNISQFYLFGTVQNPIVSYADMADKYVSHVERIYHENRLAFELVENACPELVDVNVSRIAIEAREVLDNCRLILSGENVWPYYNRVIRSGACDSIVESIGWSSSLIFVIGLIFFPLCAIVTHRYLVRWAEWAALKEDSVMKQKLVVGDLRRAASLP